MTVIYLGVLVIYLLVIYLEASLVAGIRKRLRSEIWLQITGENGTLLVSKLCP
jgi:hypothetical protein